jgi:aspartyl-tRNA(Asn)/glutamyl-tRNA(Gln) amidotransferase subunit B
VDGAWETEIGSRQPELPRARAARFVADYELSTYDVGVLTATKALADYFEACVRAGAPPKQAANWIMGDLQALLTEARIAVDACMIPPDGLSELIGLIEDGTISGKIAKDVLGDMFASGKGAKQLVDEKGLVQITDSDELARVVQEVIAANPGPADDFRAGKKQALGFLMGQVMKATQGKANPKLVSQLLERTLTQT